MNPLLIFIFKKMNRIQIALSLIDFIKNILQNLISTMRINT